MGKAVGYIVALVAIVLVIYIVATHKKAPATGSIKPSNTVVQTTPGVGAQAVTDDYASLVKFAKDRRAEQEAGIKNAPAGTAPPVTYIMLNGRVLKDTGKIVKAEDNFGRGVLYLDLNGDGQPELKLDLGGYPLPQGMTEGVSVEFHTTVSNATMDGDRLVLEGATIPGQLKIAGAK